MFFTVYAKNLSNPNSIEAFVRGFNTREEAERFCAMMHYKINYFGVFKADLIIKEVQ